MAKRPPYSCIAFLSDFGYQDSYVAEVKAVLLRHLPKIPIIDITHAISPFDISLGAFQLLRCHSFFPPQTIFLAVVDPGVGTHRRCVYVKTERYHFVGPDNGLLFWAVRECEEREKKRALAFEISLPAQASSTFHGRDVFAPFVAALVKGKKGKLVKVETLEGSAFPQAERRADGIRGELVAHDHYGNLITSIPVDWISQPRSGHIADRSVQLRPFANYEAIPHGEVGLIAGSHGYWEVACKEASAADRIGVRRGAKIVLL